MKHVLCFGDSNTWGFVPQSGLRYDEHTRWTGVLSDLLGEDWCIHEDGLNARTSVYPVSFKPFLNGLETFPAALVSQKPLDVLVLSLGTNDLKYVSAARSADGVAQLVLTAKSFDARYPAGLPVFPNGPKILVISPIQIGSGLPGHNPDSDLAHAVHESTLFSQKFAAMCANQQVELLDAQQYAVPSPVDHIHMSPESHRKLAEAVAEKLRQMVK